jgi:hypothetical protein
MENLSIEELKQKRYKSLLVSEKAARMYPDEYQAVKEIVRHVISSTIDIGQYEKTAQSLAQRLETLMKAGAGSVFSYFHENIDPRKYGHPGYFRAMCTDLEQQMKCIDQMIAGKFKADLIPLDRFRKNEDIPVDKT